MIFDGEPPSPERCIFEQLMFPIFGLVVSFTFDLLTLKSNHFIFVLNGILFANLVKFPRVVCESSQTSTVGPMITHEHTHAHVIQTDSPKILWLQRLVAGEATKYKNEFTV